MDKNDKQIDDFDYDLNNAKNMFKKSLVTALKANIVFMFYIFIVGIKWIGNVFQFCGQQILKLAKLIIIKIKNLKKN